MSKVYYLINKFEMAEFIIKLWNYNQPSGTTTFFDSCQTWLASEIWSRDISVITCSWTWKRGKNSNNLYNLLKT